MKAISCQSLSSSDCTTTFSCRVTWCLAVTTRYLRWDYFYVVLYVILLPSGCDFICCHAFDRKGDAVGFCSSYIYCRITKVLCHPAQAVARTRAMRIQQEVSHDWCLGRPRFPDLWPSPVSLAHCPELKDRLFRIWTGRAPLRLHLSSPRVMRGDLFLSCWTSSVINIRLLLSPREGGSSGLHRVWNWLFPIISNTKYIGWHVQLLGCSFFFFTNNFLFAGHPPARGLLLLQGLLQSPWSTGK